MSQKSFILGGASYPLHHLNGFRIAVPPKDPLRAEARLQVTLSCHVYSERWDASRHSQDRQFSEGHEQRAFCPTRYGCSIGLEDQIRYHVAGKAFWGKDGNGQRNSFFYGEADGIAYPIYFRLGEVDRIKGVNGILHVISAYQNPDLPAKNRFQAVKFARLVHNICPPAGC